MGAAGAVLCGAVYQRGEWALFGAGLVATAAVTFLLTRAARRQLSGARA